MARKPRLHVPGGLYHVILRGNARQDIFFSAEDRARFYELIEEGVSRFGYRVHAFCLMTNHLHLALQAGEQSLSAGMQNLAFRYTRYINARRKRAGHLFQGRFKAVLVDRDRYGLALVRYLHLNPLRARLVKQPSAYAYSSHRAYLGDEALPWLTTDWVLGQFGSRINTARSRYTRFINEGKAEGHNEAFYGGHADSRVVGEEDFVKTILKSKPVRHRPPPMTKILAYVCRSYRLRETALLAAGRARLLTRVRLPPGLRARAKLLRSRASPRHSDAISPPSVMPVSRNVRESPPLSPKPSTNTFMQLATPDPVLRPISQGPYRKAGFVFDALLRQHERDRLGQIAHRLVALLEQPVFETGDPQRDLSQQPRRRHRPRFAAGEEISGPCDIRRRPLLMRWPNGANDGVIPADRDAKHYHGMRIIGAAEAVRLLAQ